MKTYSASIGYVSNDLEKILLPTESKKDTQIAKIEDDLQAERNARNNERFVVSIVAIILVDMIAFPHISWGPCFLLGFFELILIIVLAEICGFDSIYTIIRNATDALSKLGPGGKS